MKIIGPITHLEQFTDHIEVTVNDQTPHLQPGDNLSIEQTITFVQEEPARV